MPRADGSRHTWEYVLKHPVEIGARGMIVLFPEPLNQKAEAVMISNGINLEGYMSAQLTEEDFTEDTLVLVMEHAQLEKVLENTREPTRRMYMFSRNLSEMNWRF